MPSEQFKVAELKSRSSIAPVLLLLAMLLPLLLAGCAMSCCSAVQGQYVCLWLQHGSSTHGGRCIEVDWAILLPRQ
jgi:hypothetical protein